MTRNLTLMCIDFPASSMDIRRLDSRKWPIIWYLQSQLRDKNSSRGKQTTKTMWRSSLHSNLKPVSGEWWWHWELLVELSDTGLRKWALLVAPSMTWVWQLLRLHWSSIPWEQGTCPRSVSPMHLQGAKGPRAMSKGPCLKKHNTLWL